MKVKSLGANKTELELKDLKLLISYSTPVALIRYLREAIRTKEFHSSTTSKHINQWFDYYGQDPDNVGIESQTFFDNFLEDNK